MTEENSSTIDLLPADALAGIRIGISASDSPDLARLGLMEVHFRLALGEIARSVVVSGGMLSYGGRIDPSGYTAFLVKELQRFHRRDRPLLVTLAYSEQFALTNQALQDARADMGLFGSLECLDEAGNVIADHKREGGDGNGKALESAAITQSLTNMRRRLAELCDGRIIIGGRRQGYTGELPGVLEEAICAIERRKPIYFAGGFGGVTLDALSALGIDDISWFPADKSSAVEPGLRDGLDRLVKLARESKWDPSWNGLTADENKKLAATHRPSEIAALVSLGLGRNFRRGAAKA
jgi:hypothetical protein